ncbi:MAG: alanine racemase [Myxococcota bacterium]
MSTLAKRLMERHFGDSAETLVIGGVPAEELARAHGTPLYAFDRGILERTYAELREALGDRVNVLFALKANPSVGIAQVLRLKGAGAEVASAGEIAVARQAGFDGSQMQFAGPGKHGDDLAYALDEGVTMNVESIGELEAIAAYAEARGALAPIALRVNPPDGSSGARMRMGGGSAKFGIDREDLVDAAKHAHALPSVALRGLHTYAGTQTFDADAWLTSAHMLCDAAREVEGAIDAPLTTLNFGGGFGVPVFPKDTPFDLERAGAGLQELIAEDARPERSYFVELGRYLVAEAGVFLTRVIYTKESRGRRHAILDGGMNQHATAAGLGSVFQRSFPVVKANALNDAPSEEPPCLGGPLCTPADAFPAPPALPELAPGDLVAFLVSGAYGLTFSNVLFLSHAMPSEVLVDEGTTRVLRARGVPDDAVRGQHALDDPPC